MAKELVFMNYLLGVQAFNDVLLLSADLNNSCLTKKSHKDSLHYLTGWAAYQLKKMDLSVSHLSLVSKQSAFYAKSKYFESFGYSYTGKPTQGRAVVENDSLLISNKTFKELNLLVRGSNLLLERKYEEFDSVYTQFNFDSYAVREEQEALYSRKSELLKIKKKSPFLAGCMSAIVPGTGKLYAGYTGMAAAAAIPTVLWGAAAVESYIKAGPSSPQFIIFASLFSTFYIGNIWGSVLSVKVKREERYNEVDHNILLDMHIPLRRVFN